jgi:hypothetical protein
MKITEKFWNFMERKTSEGLVSGKSNSENVLGDIISLIISSVALFMLNFSNAEILFGKTADFACRIAVVWAASALIFQSTNENWWKTITATMILIFFI